MWPVLIPLLAVALVYGGICLFYYLAQERLIFVRTRLSRGYRYRFTWPFQERFIRAVDGADLHALYFPVNEPRGLVLYFHGNTGTLRRWGKRSTRFTKRGLAVLMPEYRGYGKSRGKLSEDALLADAWQWYLEALKLFPEDQVIVYGRSLGSAMAVPVASRGRPRRLILESPFAAMRDPARHHFRWLPYDQLLRYPFRNDLSIRTIQCPVHIFHGERDQVVPFTSALRLYAAIPGQVVRSFTALPDRHHNDLGRSARFHRELRQLLA